MRKKDGGILKKSHRGGNPLAGRTHMIKDVTFTEQHNHTLQVALTENLIQMTL